MTKLSILLVFIGQIAHAQAISGNRIAVASQVSEVGSAAAVLSHTVTVNLSNVTLESALLELSRMSNTEIMFSKAAIDGSRKVSAHGEKIALGMALAQVLKGIQADVSVTSKGQVVIAPFDRKNGSRVAQGNITGKVVDAKTGKGVSGANVLLDNEGRGSVSDENGTYRLVGIATGVHTVTVRSLGYAKQTRSVSVGEGAVITVDFKLEPTASVLDQVVVTGTIIATELKAVPNDITVITAKDIERRGITRIDQLFRGDVPGLFAVNRGSQTALDEVIMFSRGASALFTSSQGLSTNSNSTLLTNPIKTYIDGVEMASSQYLGEIDPKNIERIEILTGPQASTIYGANAINGVMQIFTKRGSSAKPQLTLSLNTGVSQNDFSSHLAPSHSTNLGLSGIDGRMSYSMNGTWNYLGSWTPSRQTQGWSTSGGAKWDFGKITADVSTRHSLTQNRQNGNNNQTFTVLRTNGIYLPLVNSLGVAVPTISSLTSQTIGLTLTYRPTSWWVHAVTLGRDAENTETIAFAPKFSGPADTNASDDMSNSSSMTESYNTTVQLPVSSLAKLEITAGLDRTRTRGASWGFNTLVLNGQVTKAVGLSFLDSRTRPHRNNGALIQGQFGLYDTMFLTYGIRADWNPNIGPKVKVNPGRYGIAITHDIGPISAKLRGSYGTSIRPPNDNQVVGLLENQTSLITDFGPLYVFLPNPYLAPESHQGGEGGLELYVSNRGSIKVTRYNETVDNLISLTGSDVPANGIGLDSVRSLTNTVSANCSTDFRDANGYCYRWQRQFLNIGSIRNQGWTFTSSMNTGPLTTTGTYSWTKSRVLGITPKYKAFLPGPQYSRGQTFDFLAEHTWALGLNYSQRSSTISLSINGIGMLSKSGSTTAGPLSLATSSAARFNNIRPRIGLPTGYRVLAPGYATGDLNASHSFSKGVDGTLQIINLTNFYRSDTDAQYATIGRQTKLGVRWRIN